MIDKATAITLMWPALAAISYVISKCNDSNVSTPAWIVVIAIIGGLTTGGVLSH